MLSRLVACAAIAMVLVSPLAMAQEQMGESTPTTLYFHIFDPFAKFVINTQPYNASFFDVGGVVFPSNPHTGWDFNTIYGYSTSGPVEYDFIEGGKPRFHPERGIAADVVIDEEVQPMVYLYVDPRGTFGGYEHIPAHAPMTFRIQVRAGDDPGSDFNDGQLIMSGTFTAHLVGSRYCPAHTFNVVTGGLVYFTSCLGIVVDPNHGSQTPAGGTPGTGIYDQFPDAAPDGTPILYVDENHVIEVPIPLEMISNIIPMEDAYNVRIDWYQEFYGMAEEDEYQINNIRMVLSDQYLPRLEMNVMNPVYISFIHPQVAAGTLLIHTGVNSPWGTYDVDVNNIKLTVEGPTTPRNLNQVVAQNAHVHGLHHLDAEITYLWRFRDEGAANGDYKITMEVPNLAGNAVAVSSAGFRIDGREAFGIDDQGEIVPPSLDEGNQDAPATPGALMGLLLVAGAAFLRRRVA